MKQSNTALDFWPLMIGIWVIMAALLLLRPPLLWAWEYARSGSAASGEDKAPEPMRQTSLPAALSQPLPAAPTRPATMLALEKAIFDLTNQQRQTSKLTGLKPNPGLAAIAAMHSAAMRDQGFFAHPDPNGVGPADRAAKGMRTAFGLTAENIAKVTDQPNLANEFVEDWMNSIGHRKNILAPSRTDLGVGCAEAKPAAKSTDPKQPTDPNWVHCTQLFMDLYASSKQAFPESLRAGQTLNVEIVPENRNPIPTALRQTDVKTNAIVSKTSLIGQAGAGVGILTVQGPAGVYRLDVEIPDPKVANRYTIIPGPYVTVTP